ncbi:MAG: FAD-dependent oxidoreductase [Phycisphaerales bacterium]|nr:FAD-dependent oxidoreductase [Phycisphaerales bacterium]
MMRTRPQPDGWTLGPHLAGGLTLRHYANFRDCPSLAESRARVHDLDPRLDDYGIHVLVGQNRHGELLLGDSHEDADHHDPFNRGEINDLILQHLGEFLQAPDLRVSDTWHGVYARMTDGSSALLRHLEPGLTVATGIGGTGMTTSFAFAEDVWSQVTGAAVSR